MESSAVSVASLRQRLRRMYRRDARMQAAAAFFWGLVGSGALCALIVALEAWLWMPPPVRIVVLSSGAAGAGLYLGHTVFPPLLQSLGIWPLPSDERLARTVGASTPAIADRLVALFQLEEGRASASPPAVRHAAVQQLAAQLDPEPFDALVDTDRVRRAAPWLAVPVLATALIVAGPVALFSDASARLFSPGTAFERPAPYVLQVAPGSAELVEGDDFTVEAHITDQMGEPPSEVVVEMDTPDGVREHRMSQDDSHTWTAALSNIRSSFSYRVRTAEVQSTTYDVDVAARPQVRRLNVTVHPPAYTNQTPESLPANTGDVTALPGSEVHVQATLGGGPITEAALQFEGTADRPMTVASDNASARFTVEQPTTYQIHIQNEEGIPNPDPIRHRVEVRPDEPPRISFEAPDPMTTLESDRTTELDLRIRDDFGFSQLRIHYRPHYGGESDEDVSFESFDIPIDAPYDTDQRVEHTWLLLQDTGLDLLPGDEVEYYAEVWDNDAVAGFKSAETNRQRLRMPTAADRYADLDRSQDDTQSALDAVNERSSALQQQFEQLRDEVHRTQDASWEDREEAQRLREQQEEMSQQIDEAAQRLEESTRQMERDGLAREETQQMYQELQDVIQEIDNPDLQDALRQLQEAMEELDFGDMQQSMGDVEDELADYQERLERAMELFKRLRTQQKLDEMTDRADQLDEQQGDLQSDTEAAAQDADEAPDSDALQRRQEDARAEMEALQEALDDFAEDLADTPNAPTDSYDDLQEQLEQGDIQEQMEAAAEALQQQDWSSAQDAQQQAGDQLADMSESLGQMQAEMDQAQSQMNVNAIWYALENTLWLSKEQEALRNEVSQFADDAAELRTLMRTQNNLRTGLESVGDSLSAAARNTPQLRQVVRERLGAGLNAMQQAVQHLDDREGDQARPQQTDAMTVLNELALLLSQLLDQMEGEGGGEGGGMSMDQMIQQMQEMSGDQQALNRELQEHLENVAGERLSVDEEARREQIAAEQERLQEAMRAMSEEDAADQMLGDLDDIADAMEESLRDLENPRNERDLLDRQQRILSRMLDAQRALQAQGQSDDRQGDRPGDIERRPSPDELPPHEATEALRQALIDALEGGYSTEYETLIRRYFEALEND